MNEQTTKAFRDVLDKFIHIGNCYYNKKHHDNVLNIFADLEEEDKKIFLRGVYYIYTIVELGTNNPLLNSDTTQEDGSSDENSNSSSYNNKLMIEMKFWFIKTAGAILFTALTFFILFVLYTTSSISDGQEATTGLIKVLGLLFN